MLLLASGINCQLPAAYRLHSAPSIRSSGCIVNSTERYVKQMAASTPAISFAENCLQFVLPVSALFLCLVEHMEAELMILELVTKLLP